MKRILSGMLLALSLGISSCQAQGPTDATYTLEVGAINDSLIDGAGGATDPLVSLQTYTDTTDRRTIRIPNGSALNFASRDLVGRCIRLVSAMNDVPNPLGISHSGVVVNDDPRAIYEILTNLNSGSILGDYQPQPAAINHMIYNLRTSYGHIFDLSSPIVDDNAVLFPFCLEANGTAGQVLTGIRPHVQIRALHPVVDGYDGNVYVRKLFAGLELEKTREFMMAHLGRPYEGFRTFLDLARAPISANLVEDTSRLFCSEMAALLYRTYCGIDIPNVSNVIPESLGSGAGRYDLLQLIADVETPLKLQYAFPSTDPDCCCCWAGPKSGRCVLM